jgi:hypothetical protein
MSNQEEAMGSEISYATKKKSVKCDYLEQEAERCVCVSLCLCTYICAPRHNSSG